MILCFTDPAGLNFEKKVCLRDYKLHPVETYDGKFCMAECEPETVVMLIRFYPRRSRGIQPYPRRILGCISSTEHSLS